MDSVTIENFRCFGEKQTVRLAPLTLLVGENGTGKTSFLALIRALWDMAYGFRVPDFKEPPYDLGSFVDIVHRGRRDQPAHDQFEMALSRTLDRDASNENIRFEFEFSKRDSAPFPVTRRYNRRLTKIEESISDDEQVSLNLATKRGKWRLIPNGETAYYLGGQSTVAWLAYWLREGHHRQTAFAPCCSSPDLSEDDKEEIGAFAHDLLHSNTSRPLAGAPTRSRPQRSYHYSRLLYVPEGAHIPNLLATFAAQDEDGWSRLKEFFGFFGRDSGLFDEITVEQFGADSDIFQIKVRRNSKQGKGMWHNIVDVGYGVSQVLPVVAEIAFHSEPDVILLQQPEVHLHPMAQAELGTLLGSFASGHAQRRRYVVETHSDHLINRVRMDVRDSVADLRPEDVVVLYFERRDFDVKIHEITFDELGNLNGAPPSYGNFFMRETSRSIWPDADLADL